MGACEVTCSRRPPSAADAAAELEKRTTMDPKAVSGATSTGRCDPSPLPSPTTTAATPGAAASETETPAALLRFTRVKRSSGMKFGAVEKVTVQMAGDGCVAAPTFVETGAMSC